MSHRVLTAHVPDALAKRKDALSAQLDRPRGWIVAEALTRYVDLEKERHQLTLEALADVEAGRVVSHDEVGKCVAGLRKTRRGKR